MSDEDYFPHAPKTSAKLRADSICMERYGIPYDEVCRLFKGDVQQPEWFRPTEGFDRMVASRMSEAGMEVPTKLKLTAMQAKGDPDPEGISMKDLAKAMFSDDPESEVGRHSMPRGIRDAATRPYLSKATYAPNPDGSASIKTQDGSGTLHRDGSWDNGQPETPKIPKIPKA